jgi:SAM-dependent methyltransferase
MKKYLALVVLIVRALAKLNPRIILVAFHPMFYEISHFTQEKKNKRKLLPYFENKRGICISGSLRWKFETYPKSASQVINVDNVAFFFGQPTNADYLTDATELYFARDNEFDFVCSSHVLEHLANPIKALKEWIRVVKKGGIIYTEIPDKRFIFDYKRHRTSLRHLIDDYQKNIGPHDMTHLSDFAYKLDLDMLQQSPEQCFSNILKYIASGSSSTSEPHHHVYTKEDLTSLFRYVGLEILFVTIVGETIHLVGKK